MIYFSKVLSETVEQTTMQNNIDCLLLYISWE